MNCYQMTFLLTIVPALILVVLWISWVLLTHKKVCIWSGKLVVTPIYGELIDIVDGEKVERYGLYIGDKFIYEDPRPAYQNVIGMLMLIVALVLICWGLQCLTIQ